LLVFLELISIRLSSIQILCGQLEIPAIEEPGPGFEILDGWDGCRLAGRRG
jgi:hypothetical protein